MFRWRFCCYLRESLLRQYRFCTRYMFWGEVLVENVIGTQKVEKVQAFYRDKESLHWPQKSNSQIYNPPFSHLLNSPTNEYSVLTSQILFILQASYISFHVPLCQHLFDKLWLSHRKVTKAESAEVKFFRNGKWCNTKLYKTLSEEMPNN